MVEYEKLLLAEAHKVDPNIMLSINGSYKRKMPDSGDIDVLITSKQNVAASRKKFIEHLKKKGIIIETLANGKKKFMGISKLPNFTKFRHIDIIESDVKSYPFGVLYFTGSGGFNARMRGVALSKGYSLNEYDFTHKLTKKPVTSEEIMAKIGKPQFEDEHEIFQFIDMDYVLPEDRVNITPSKV